MTWLYSALELKPLIINPFINPCWNSELKNNDLDHGFWLLYIQSCNFGQMVLKFTTDISILTHNFKVTKHTLSRTGQQENGHAFLGTSPT